MHKSDQLIQGWERDGLMTILVRDLPTVRDYDPTFMEHLRKSNARLARRYLALARAERLAGRHQSAVRHLLSAGFWISRVRAAA